MDSCLQCLSTVRLPKALLSDSTSIPTGFGTNFSADVLERVGQAIFVCKEELTQHVTSMIIEDQTTKSLRDAVISTPVPLVNISGGKIRLDSAPGHQSLANNQARDPVLQQLKLKVELSQPLNKNGNPQAENAIGELKREILNIVSKDDPLSPSTLALATRTRYLNNRIRSNNRSAWESLTSRDAMTSKPFKQDDAKSLSALAERRKMQHVANEKSNLKSKTRVETSPFYKG